MLVNLQLCFIHGRLEKTLANPFFKLNFELYVIMKNFIMKTTATVCNDFVVTTLPHGNLDPAHELSLPRKKQLFSP